MQSSLLANDEFVIEPNPNDDYNYSYSNNNATTTTNASATPSTTRTYPIVQVIAPETLAQGYTFDVEFNHEILSVVVVRIVIVIIIVIIIYDIVYLLSICLLLPSHLKGDSRCNYFSFSVIQYHFNT